MKKGVRLDALFCYKYNILNYFVIFLYFFGCYKHFLLISVKIKFFDILINSKTQL